MAVQARVAAIDDGGKPSALMMSVVRVCLMAVVSSKYAGRCQLFALGCRCVMVSAAEWHTLPKA
eukprot:6200416-Pleurochrysis_carterae.AAC.2